MSRVRSVVPSGAIPLALSLLLSGCASDLLSDDARSGEEFVEAESTSQAVTASGCNAVYVSGEKHTGAIHHGSDDIDVGRIEFTIRNSSSTPCAEVGIKIRVVTQRNGSAEERLRTSGTLVTSLAAKASKRIYWDVNRSTGAVTTVPIVRAYAGDRLILETDLVTYYYATQQWD